MFTIAIMIITMPGADCAGVGYRIAVLERFIFGIKYQRKKLIKYALVCGRILVKTFENLYCYMTMILYNVKIPKYH